MNAAVHRLSLCVRAAGFSACFTDLTEAMQAGIISRTEHQI